MTTRTIPIAVFRLGHLVSTPNALQSLSQEEILRGIQRHQAGDWGDLKGGDWEANDRALAQGGRIVSAYIAKNGTRFWIITEADRSATTVLLPEDY
jgi:hypothetical protein